MSYDVKTQGIVDYRLTNDRLKKQVRDPLEGIVGVNTVFRARYYPVSGAPTPVVYTSGSVASSEYSVDNDTGTVVFNNAPSAQPSMTYYWSNMTDDEVVDILVGAFQEMEMRWPRRWKLVDSDGTTEVFTPSSATEINIVDQNLNDPPCGPDTFSTSVVERKLLMACARYTTLASRLDFAAERYFSYREDRGITVDKRDVPKNLDIALTRADSQVKQALRAAQAKYFSGGEHLGAAMKQPGTVDYFEHYEWQTDSRDLDHRDTYAGTG